MMKHFKYLKIWFTFKLEWMNAYTHTCMHIPFLPCTWITFFSTWKVILSNLKLQTIIRISPLWYVLLLFKKQWLTYSWPFLSLSWLSYYLLWPLPQNWQPFASPNCSYNFMYVRTASDKVNCRLSVITEQPPHTCRTHRSCTYFVQIPFNSF